MISTIHFHQNLSSKLNFTDIQLSRCDSVKQKQMEKRFPVHNLSETTVETTEICYSC